MFFSLVTRFVCLLFVLISLFLFQRGRWVVLASFFSAGEPLNTFLAGEPLNTFSAGGR